MSHHIDTLQLKVAQLSRKTHELGIPVMIIFEGIPASGKTRLSNDLLLQLDAKYTNFIATKSPETYDLRYQFLQKYWNTLPQKGYINIYFRSWYSHYLDYKENKIKHHQYVNYDSLLKQISNFESMLKKDNYEIIKFFIEINEEKRQAHIQQTKSNPLMRWKVQEYEEVISQDVYLNEMRRIIHNCNDWQVIDYTVREQAITNMYLHIIERLEYALEKYQKHEEYIDGEFNSHFSTSLFNIAGKGGNIKRIREKLDPTGYEVNGISEPTDVEKNHHYLWRFATKMPKSGHIEIFDRSWYGRILVERVEGFAEHHEWKRAYDEINQFERMWTDEGTIIIKFFLCLDKEEQLQRFKDREQNPNKQWKITDEDWRNREKWDMYLEASQDMIKYTNTKLAPWHVIKADHKKTSRLEVLKTIIKRCEDVL